MLVVVEDGNVAYLLEPALDLKAVGSADILKINAAEAAGQQIHRAHDLVHVLGAQADGEGVHVGKLLKQRAFALHNGHGGVRADVAQTENRGTVADNGDEIVAARQRPRQLRILLYFKAGLRDARRVRKRQRLPVLDLNSGDDLYLAAPLLVLCERFFVDSHISDSFQHICSGWNSSSNFSPSR